MKKIMGLFSGSGSFEYGISKGAGFDIVGGCEVDSKIKEAFQVLHGFEPFGDITTLTSEEIPNFDVLVGGSPCQAFSIAGARKGFDDTRGTLFFDYVRILKEKQPLCFVFENVKNLISHDKGKTFETILRAFNEVGYRVDFKVLNSKHYKVPQNRERIFIVGFRKDVVPYEVWHQPEEKNTTYAKKKKQLKDSIDSFNFTYPEKQTDYLVLKDVLQPLEEIPAKYFVKSDKLKHFKFRDKKDRKNKSILAGSIDSYNYKADGFICDEKNISHCLTVSNLHKAKVLVKEEAGIIVEGNFANTNFDSASKVLSTEGISTCLTVSSVDETRIVLNKDIEKDVDYFVYEDKKYFIRRITPLESFLVQSYPKDWFYKLKASNVSDSTIYKLSGNGVSTNVAVAMGKSLKSFMECHDLL